MREVKAQEIICGLGHPQQKRLSDYCRGLDHDKLGRLFDVPMYLTLSKYLRPGFSASKEKGFLDSVGYAQSIYKRERIDEQLARFTQPDHQKFCWNSNYRKAKELLCQEFSRYDLHSLRYFSKENVVNAIPRLDTHAGFEYILTGKRSKGEYVEEAFTLYQVRYQYALSNGTFDLPILIGVRNQAKPPYKDGVRVYDQFNGKTRMVSMISLSQVICENKFASPVQDRMGEVAWYAGGKDDATIRSYLREDARNTDWWTSIDYSSYDQTISSWLIHDAFDIIREGFRNDLFFDEQLFTVVRNDFIHKVFISPDGACVQAHKGVPSGSMFTQIIDSIVNRLMITTYLLAKGFNMEAARMMIMGDDNIIWTQERIDLEDLSSYLSHNFGITANPSKCSQGSVSVYPEFLSREWRPGGNWRDPYILMGKLLFPERFRDYKGKGFSPMHIIRAYLDTFPAGMRELINYNQFEDDEGYNIRDESGGDYLTGLMRYRKLYLEKSHCIRYYGS